MELTTRKLTKQNTANLTILAYQIYDIKHTEYTNGIRRIHRIQSFKGYLWGFSNLPPPAKRRF